VLVPQKAANHKSAIIAVGGAGGSAESEPGALEKLARQGHVVIEADLRGLGESQPPQQGKSGYQGRYQTAMRAILVGKTVLGMQVYDLLRVLRYTAARPDVDPSRITLWGKGTAAVAALYTAALAPQVQKVILERSVLSYMDIVRAVVYEGNLTDLVVPGVLHDFDLPDIARSIGSDKVVLLNPVRPDGSAVRPEEAAREYGQHVRIANAGVTYSTFN
jgi:cephalosporin-C deacetylase-like acetyl esterase